MIELFTIKAFNGETYRIMGDRKEFALQWNEKGKKWGTIIYRPNNEAGMSYILTDLREEICDEFFLRAIDKKCTLEPTEDD